MKPERYVPQNKRLKKLTDDMIEKVEGEVKALLHESRNALRFTGKYDTTKTSFDTHNTYYSEAMGIFKALYVLGYGFYGAINQTAFQSRNGSHKCEYCLEKYPCDKYLQKPPT